MSAQSTLGKKKRHGRRQDSDGEFAGCQDGKTLGKDVVFLKCFAATLQALGKVVIFFF
jgi:hypothetical protein